MNRPDSAVVRIGAEAHVKNSDLSAQTAGDRLWTRDVRCSTLLP